MNTEVDRLLTLREVALRLGVSIRKIYRMIHDGNLPQPLKVGRAARLPESELVAFVESLKQRRGPSYTA